MDGITFSLAIGDQLDVVLVFGPYLGNLVDLIGGAGHQFAHCSHEGVELIYIILFLMTRAILVLTAVDTVLNDNSKGFHRSLVFIVLGLQEFIVRNVSFVIFWVTLFVIRSVWII